MESEKNEKVPGMQHISEVLKNLQPKDTGRALSDEAGEGEQFTCAVCRDAHIVHPLHEDGKVDYSTVVPCECIRELMEKERVRNLLRYCELPVRTDYMTFEKFKVTPELQEAYDLALQFAEGSDEIPWLTFMAGTNRGKTHLAIAICRRWIERGIPAKYAYVPLIFEELRRGFREDGDRSYEARFDRFKNIPLLVLDDLGTENRTPWVQEKMDIIVDYRLVQGLHLVVTTNTPMDELPFRIRGNFQQNL
ncbi:unnamed protein product [marine sediment metagenome]|uniref:IstB-like ATP-binding domain-containing protein n=1 Tax=marine sediment metagenome TaxID=412755 RepID=X1R8A5_9ZZZZ